MKDNIGKYVFSDNVEGDTANLTIIDEGIYNSEDEAVEAARKEYADKFCNGKFKQIFVGQATEVTIYNIRTHLLLTDEPCDDPCEICGYEGDSNE